MNNSGRILVTGATGNTGSAIIEALGKRNQAVVAAVRNPEDARQFSDPIDWVVFNLNNPQTFEHALKGISKVYLMRPPAIADSKVFRLFVEAAKKSGVEHIVYLSVMGAEKNPVIPHYSIEKLIMASRIPYTFLRPSYFMQNLSTTHRGDIRLHNEIFVPAGKGKTSFIDVRDIAEVAALALSEEGHLNKAYELSGNEALDYYQVAEIFTEVLGRQITYKRPSVLQFFVETKRRNIPTGFVMVMVALYTVASLGLAKKVTYEVKQLLNREPISFRQFIEDNKACWQP